MLRQENQLYRSIVVGVVLPAVLSGCLMNESVDEDSGNNAQTPTGDNNPPKITGNAPRVVKVGVAYAFHPVATDADGDRLTFDINNKPAWLGFDASIGRLSGMPSLGNEGTYNDIEITVSDGDVTTMLSPFSITVEPNSAPNMPPEIDGIPAASVTVGQTYSFTPAGFDPDGDLLRYAIQNRPVWATFNAASGRLSGTPQAGDVGSYANIAISVSDGISSDALPGFTITVNQTGTESTTLTWIPPTQNEDGSPLTDLAGYKIYYGTSAGDYANEITINNPGITTYVVNNLSPNTWYFVSTSFNASGVESIFSNAVSRTIN